MRIRELKESAYEDIGFEYEYQLKEYLGDKYDMALEYIKSGRCLYRGMKATSTVIFGDGNQLERKSANTQNYYTLFTQLLPSWKGWPLRSKSFICSNLTYSTTSYGSTFLVIPLENQPIAIAPESDFWNSFSDISEIFDGDLWEFNNTLKKIMAKLDVSDPNNVEEMKTWLRDLNDSADDLVRQFTEISEPRYKTEIKFLKMVEEFGIMTTLDRLFNPENNGFRMVNADNYSNTSDRSRESWLSGKVLFINYKYAENKGWVY